MYKFYLYIYKYISDLTTSVIFFVFTISNLRAFPIYTPEYNKIVSLACYCLTMFVLLMPRLLLIARKALVTIHPV